MSLRPLTVLKPWRVLRRTTQLRADPWFEVAVEDVQLPDGRVIRDYFQIDQRDYVEIVTVDRHGRILGLWRYKHGPRRVNLGLPAGYLEARESALAAAKRELREELGLAAQRWRKLGAFCLDGNRSQARCHIYLALQPRPAPAVASDDLEKTEAVWLEPADWRRALQAGQIATLGVATAILLALREFEL